MLSTVGAMGVPGGVTSHPELGYSAHVQTPGGVAAPHGVLQGFGGGISVAGAGGAPTPRARGRQVEGSSNLTQVE